MRNNRFPERIIWEKKNQQGVIECDKEKATMGFSGTPHRSNGDRLLGRGVQPVHALKCVKIHIVQDPAREMLIRV